MWLMQQRNLLELVWRSFATCLQLVLIFCNWSFLSMELVWRPTCPTINDIMKFHLSDVPLVWQRNLRYKFSPTIYTNQKFWFHLCYIHSSCPYDPLNKIMCFVLANFTLVNSNRCFRKDSVTEDFVCYAWETLADDAVFILIEFRNAK